MQNLLIGINTLGAKTLCFIQKTTKFRKLKQNSDMLLLRDGYDQGSIYYNFSVIGCSCAFDIINTNTDIKDKDELFNYLQKVKKVIIFAGVGGAFSNKILRELIEKIERKKLYIVAISPFSFEGKAKAALAKDMLRVITEAQIGCSLYSNNDLLDSNNTLGVVARMVQFFDKIVFETFYNQEGGYIGV